MLNKVFKEKIDEALEIYMDDMILYTKAPHPRVPKSLVMQYHAQPIEVYVLGPS